MAKKMRWQERCRKREQLLEKHGPYCCYCGKYLTKKDRTIEHLIARRDGGSNRLDNLRLACYYCNHSRHNNIKQPLQLWQKDLAEKNLKRLQNAKKLI